MEGDCSEREKLHFICRSCSSAVIGDSEISDPTLIITALSSEAVLPPVSVLVGVYFHNLTKCSFCLLQHTDEKRKIAKEGSCRSTHFS